MTRPRGTPGVGPGPRGSVLSRRTFVLVVLASGILACGGGDGSEGQLDGAGGTGPDGGGPGGDGGPSHGGGGGARASDGAPPDDATTSVECSDRAGTVTIDRNHGHHLVVPREHFDLGVAQSYDIQGVSAHAHQVTLGAADFEALARGEMVTVASSFDQSHHHDVVIGCV